MNRVPAGLSWSRSETVFRLKGNSDFVTFCGNRLGTVSRMGRLGSTSNSLECGHLFIIDHLRKRKLRISCKGRSSETVGISKEENNSPCCERESAETGGGREDTKLGRRKALTLSVAASMAALELDGMWPGISDNSARALIQTGMERGEQKAAGNAVDNLKSRVSIFTLDNGMQWIVLERHNAPVVSCHTYANVGASSETTGMTGLAHFLEHLAFKGTRLVGTRDPDKEASLLNQLDDVFYALQEANKEGRFADAKQLNKKFVELQVAAAQFSVPNEYGFLIERQGGIGLNAQTSQDSTEYFVSLPANKLELWMALESGRFIAPVFREVYSEKEVIKEERRLRVDNTPFGRFTEAFSEAAFPQQPYGRPVIGYPDDFERLGRREVEKFFKQNYTPQALTCAVVGDVDPAEVKRLARRYFGPWETTSKPDSFVSTAAQTWRQSTGWDNIVRADGKRTLRLNLPAQPLYMEGYYRPPASSLDDPALTVLNEVLTGGRSSRFYKRVILPGKALSAQSAESFPGDKLPCLLLLYAIPPQGTSTDYLAAVLHKELEDLVTKSVTQDELLPIKKYARASLLESEVLKGIGCLSEMLGSVWEQPSNGQASLFISSNNKQVGKPLGSE